MHFHIGLVEFLVFCLYYFILKAALLVVHIESKRHGLSVPSAVSGLLS